jgi:hypothetical protein
MTPTGDSLTARFAVPEVTERLYIAVDSQARRHMLIPLEDNQGDFNDDQSRGISVETRALVLKDRNMQRYIDIICRDTPGHDAFDVIGGELATGLASSGLAPARIVSLTLAKWRRFWGNAPRQILSREEQIGLFAEIWFLSEWLIPYVGADEAVARWRGPYGTRHDFEWAGRSVEVKATSSTRGRIHRINGLDQLTPPENGRLNLFSIQVREEDGAENTLFRIVTACRSKLESSPEAMDRFESALIQTGYSIVHEGEYTKLRLRIVDGALFRVEDDFPRITRNSFATGVPSGIEHVDYEVSLNGFDRLIVASQPVSVTEL